MAETPHILVTGATGFVGRYAVEALLARGARVTCLVRQPETALSCVQVQWDMADDAEGLLQRTGNADALLHLAWEGLPCYTGEHHGGQVDAHARFVAGCVGQGVAQVVVAGTCFEYGLREGCLTEEAPCAPVTAYGEAKHALHQELLALRKEHPFALTWARLFYLYGDGQAKNSLYPQLKDAAARGEQQFNMSGGEQLRDYLPVAQAAAMLAELALCGEEAGTVNVCSGTPVALKNLVRGWLQTFGGTDMELNLGYYPYPAHEPMAFWGDNRKYNDIIRKANAGGYQLDSC